MLAKLIFLLFLGVVQDLWKKELVVGAHELFVPAQHGVSKRRGIAEISNCTSSSSSTSSIFLQWPANVTVDWLIKGFIVSYWPLHIDPRVHQEIDAGLRTSFQVERLVENTYYGLSVRAYGHGNSNTSKLVCEAAVKTKRNASFQVYNVQAKHINDSSMLVQWSPLTSRGIAVNYQVYLKWKSDGKIYVRLMCVDSATRCLIRIEPKFPIPHVVFVKAQTTDLSTDKISRIRLSIKPLSWNSVRVSWIKPTAGGDIFKYQLVYSSPGNAAPKQINTTSNEVVISRLSQLKRYTFKLVVSDKAGQVVMTSDEGYTTTLDRNECLESVDECSINASCMNTEGSYFCRCHDGFAGNGKSCKALSPTVSKHDFCASEVNMSIIWQRTLGGNTALAPCPGGAEGTASRLCVSYPGERARWLAADLSDCVSKWMADIHRQLEDPDTDPEVMANELASSTSASSGKEINPGDLTMAVGVIQQLTLKAFGKVLENITEEEAQNKTKQLAKTLVKTSSNILDKKSMSSWNYVPKGLKTSTASRLIKIVDSLALNVAKIVKTDKPFVVETPAVVFSAQSFTEDINHDQRLPALSEEQRAPSSSVILPKKALRMQGANKDGRRYITFVLYKTLGPLMEPKGETDTPEGFVDAPEGGGAVNSPVVSVTIDPLNHKHFSSPVVLVLEHSKNAPDDSQASCVFWNMTSTPGVWSDQGCRLHATNKSHTVCHCYHLTSFAVLMQVNENADVKLSRSNRIALGLISYICIGISVCALVVTFLSFSCLSFVKSSRHFIHANLAISLALAELLFLLGIGRTENQTACRVVAGALHYLFLVSFAWMTSEGVVLYLMLVKVFESKMTTNAKNLIFFACSWGIPAVVVAVCAGVYHEGYGTVKFCWLTTKRGFIWAFVAPVIGTVAFNFFCLVKTCGIIGSRGEFQERKSKLKKIKLWAKAAVLLTCLLGLTWILGLFFLNEQWVVIAYLFNILTALQGLMIFLCHCILDKKVRIEYQKMLCKTTEFSRSMKEDKSSDSIFRKFSSQRRSVSLTTRMSRTSFKASFDRRSASDKFPTHFFSSKKKEVKTIDESTPTVGRRVRSLNYEEMTPVLFSVGDREPPTGSQETIDINDRVDVDEEGTLACSYTGSVESAPLVIEASMAREQCSPKERSRRESLV